MRQISAFLLTLTVLLIGCTSDGTMVSISDRVNDEMEGVEFHPRLPTAVPFEVKEVRIDETTPKSTYVDVKVTDQLSIDVFGTNGEWLKIHILKGNSGNGYEGEGVQTEEVSIGDDSGTYYKDDTEKQSVVWSEDDASYHMTYGYMDHENKSDSLNITKEQLIKIAERFEKFE
ncbi:DUF4367 domain-containing protein [Thalassobacillus hwangdonensis]|uniref:DUF4367 domain-containing protein n=1 Tax=Thalassobacillus hwangdonensis TaxID=546108 RepID=A0ABW3L2Z4_9BACI